MYFLFLHVESIWSKHINNRGHMMKYVAVMEVYFLIEDEV